MMGSMRRVFLLLPMAALLLAQASQNSLPATAAALRPQVQSWSPIKDEHLRPVLRTMNLATAPRIPFQLSTLHVGKTLSGPTVDLSNAFLTRPYMNYHFATSIFDHCNPDYSTDGRICASDGTVGLKSNGVDPNFSLGYAATPGGSDYLYYDGHNGWDLSLNYENVMAAADGVVKIAGIDSVNPCFGTNIVIDHPNGFSTRYAHLSQVYVSVGQAVTRGQIIGVSGNTGCSTGPHLHFGVYITSSWTAIDPFGWTGAPGADPWPSDSGDLWLTGNPQNPIPWAPTNVAATPDNGGATITWQPPAFDGGSGIAGYQVTSNPGGVIGNVSGNQLAAYLGDLTNGTPYTFTVVAINNNGSSPASAASNAVVPTAVPGPPVSVTAAPQNEAVSVSWSPPSQTGGSPVTSYTVTSTTGNLKTTVSNGTSASFTGVTSTTPLTFTVAATNSAGTGASSAPSNAIAPYPVQQMYTLEAFGGVHPDAASANEPGTAYWPNWRIARSAALLSDGSGGYVVDGYGGLHNFGQAPSEQPSAYWSGWDIARDIVLLPGSTSAHVQGYVLEGFGGLHGFGGAPAPRLSTYWSGWDIARRVVMLSDGTGGYVMDAWGGLHPFAVGTNPMPPAITNAPYWHGWSIARDVALMPGSAASNVVGVVLDGFGGVHPFGNAGAVTSMAYWSGWDIARSVQFSPLSTAANPQGWVLDGYGGIHPFGGAAGVPGASWPNSDIAVKLLVR